MGGPSGSGSITKTRLMRTDHPSVPSHVGVAFSSSSRFRGIVVWPLAVGLILAGATSASAAQGPGIDWSAFLGPFHVVLLHYPIGFLTLAALLEFASIWYPREVPARLIGAVLLLTTLAAAAAAGLGLLRASHGEFDPELLSDHRFFGLAVAVLVAAACGLQWAVQWRPGRWGRWAYRLVLGMSVLCLVAAGHQGGSLTHGSTFLTQNLPGFLGGAAGKLPAGGQPPSTGGTSLFSASIEPVLARKCYSCHGPDKQKGKLRLDTPEALFRGGKSGEPTVVPGDPAKSRLVKVLLLPRTDDDAMPPEGKEPMTDSETLAVVRWILAGAPMDGAGPR